MKNWQFILLIFGAWNVLGFLIGGMDTGNERGGTQQCTGSGPTWKCEVVDIHSGCVYKSFASFTNVGYVVACELFRKRFEIEGVIK